MTQPRVQCCWPGCRKARKVDPLKWAEYREECAGLGARPGMICPAHFAAAVADEDQYAIDIPAGELLAELVKNTPQWRLVYLPPDRTEKKENAAIRK